MSDTGFSLEISDKYTRLCESRLSGKKIEIQSIGYEETTPGFFLNDSEKVLKDQAELIKKMVMNAKVKKRGVHVIIPDSYSFSQIVEMPRLKEKELLAAIRYQSDEFIPMPIDETSIDLEILHEDSTTKKLLILIVASAKKIVNQVEKVIDMSGLVPESLENELSVAGRMFNEIMPVKSSTIVVNFGYYSSSIYLIDGATSLIIMSRTFKMGLDLFIKDVKVNMNWDDKKAFDALKTVGFAANGSVNLATLFSPLMNEFATEIRKFLVLSRDHYNANLNEIFIYNYVPYFNLFDKMLEQLLKLKVEQLPINQYILPGPTVAALEKELPSFVSAVGGNIR